MKNELKDRIVVHGPVPESGYSETGHCLECGGLWPGHKLDCKIDNARAAKYQATLASRRRNRK